MHGSGQSWEHGERYECINVWVDSKGIDYCIIGQRVLLAQMLILMGPFLCSSWRYDKLYKADITITTWIIRSIAFKCRGSS